MYHVAAAGGSEGAVHPIPTEEPLAKLALINVRVALDKMAVKCLC